MRQSRVLIPTLKETPNGAEAISHQLMLRAGYISQISAGNYAYLPLAYRVLQNIEKIIREEMAKIDAAEILLPGLLPAELWQESGRYDTYGANLFKLQDRHERDFILGPTHEETMTFLVRNVLNSYKKMPKVLYQIQTKYRDEDRPRYGLLRGREFIMKDAYSFTANKEDLDVIFDQMEQAYRNIYDRCHLEYRTILGDNGDMGGSGSKEFSAIAPVGEDTIVYSDVSDYAANLEMATSIIAPNPDQAPKPLEEVSTDHGQTMTDLAALLDINLQQTIKSVAYIADGQPVLVIIRGDFEVNDVKLKNHLHAVDLRLATDDEVIQNFQSVIGFVGPVNLPSDVRLIADLSIDNLANAACGSNVENMQLKNVNASRDYQPEEYTDIRLVKEGELSPDNKGVLQFTRGIEIGHIFKLGTKYSESMHANFLDENGKQKPIIMGSYGIGVSRLLSAIVEQNHDEAGMIWSWDLAPYQVHVVAVNTKDEAQVALAEQLETTLNDEGLSVLYDDRKERPGVKFAESDLLGIPVRITVGKKASDNIVEIKLRQQAESIEVAVDDVEDTIKILLQNND
ncbi:proline--tRNA ligase [Bombilactobacillus thymidiniphilus]|uniref:Proline--tRNA ligase n=1 Tax=Bombilactobacillus thymidiniphilus TaxID=2923363 RepID=A0ABY4PCK8_9LACO|nr:proline--tRNA ligase [Bombilactobacillus thymidiniphilus]UQS83495.1 proline--tRNA ligase [Bombilactobacillus thymidiniphilus]